MCKSYTPAVPVLEIEPACCPRPQPPPPRHRDRPPPAPTSLPSPAATLCKEWLAAHHDFDRLISTDCWCHHTGARANTICVSLTRLISGAGCSQICSPCQKTDFRPASLTVAAQKSKHRPHLTHCPVWPCLAGRFAAAAGATAVGRWLCRRRLCCTDLPNSCCARRGSSRVRRQLCQCCSRRQQRTC